MPALDRDLRRATTHAASQRASCERTRPAPRATAATLADARETVRRTGLCRSVSVTAQIKNTRPAQSKRPESGEGVGALGLGALGLGALTTSSKVWFSSRVNMPASRAWGPAMGRGHVERAGKLRGECMGGGPPAGGAQMRSEALWSGRSLTTLTRHLATDNPTH